MTHQLTEESWSALLDRQRELEDSAYAEGANRFRRRLEQAEQGGGASTVGGAKKLLQGGLDKMVEAIKLVIDAPSGQGIGKKHIAAKWCEMVRPEVAAYMTLKVVLDGIAKRAKLREAAMRISGMILDELRYREFQAQAPQLFQYKLKSFHTSSYSHRAKSLNASMSFADIDVSHLDMPPAQKMRLGIKLIDILIECTGLIELDHKQAMLPHAGRKSAHRTEVYLVATKETRDWLKIRNDALELMQPIVLPMVVPPLKWESGRRGGYRFKLKGAHALTRRTSKAHAAKIRDTHMPMVYDAINTLQNTAWKINGSVLAVVKQIIEQGGGLAGIPFLNDIKLPAKPHDIDTNAEARKAWRKLARPIREMNHIRRQKAVDVYKLLASASAVHSETDIYFPYSLDFRGRIYPISAYLSPHGDDLSKSLLTFADGKPIDEEGSKWLAIHGANCLGETPEGLKVSKLTFAERFEWICKNSDRIIKAATSPFTDTWWASAEDPLQFLAFCIEWYGLIRANDKGQSYICSLPCSMDGSCNGLQHFSALLCDAEGGAAVNLVPQDRPQDIYSRISDIVLRKLESEATTDTVALLWLGLHNKQGIVNRKLAKRPTMTFGYGSKRFGFKQQIMEFLLGMDNYREIKTHFISRQEDGTDKPQLGVACGLMSRLIWEALQEVVVAAFNGMAWMQHATRGIVKQNKAVEWTVPITGFPVRQEYFKMDRKRVTTVLAGSTISPSIWSDTEKVNPTKQSNAIAPNFVHSLDAAALMLTVVNASAEGIEQFAMVHDSYGTVPSDCALLARVCRQSFAKLYMQQDVAGDLHAQLAAQHSDPAKCPVPPAKGTLDVSLVLGSDYFFG